ncbi:site-specific integrase [Companilactobacillus allii]|uniref:Site-specific integrase n=1 Tax=Companilactobacillus allii TaxID=1847728 RepID=A0A1P8Q2L7_9LACO|nr:site-specific integrase [Companilactobacillus allii]APX72039.1 hypothetical protein BTM29_05455 [Companilactobacillus allii]USQ69132.1 site-specific integrase [Companilactobacillus allii]
MSIKKRSGKWEARVSYKDSHGKYRTKSATFDRKSAAQDYERSMSLDKKKLDFEKIDISLFDYYTKWSKLYRYPSVNEDGVKRYKNYGKKIKEHFGSKRLIDVTRSDYQEFINEYGKTKSKSTVGRMNSYVKAMCEEAIDEGIMRRNFTRNVKIVFGVQPVNEEDKYLQLSDFSKLLHHAELRYDLSNTSALEVIFIGASGVRFEEAHALSWNNVHFENNTVTIMQAIPSGKKDIKDTKNRTSTRTITINPKTMELLKKQKTIQENYYKSKNIKNEHDFVFRNKKQENPSNKAVSDMIKELLIEADIKDVITPHGLRHTHVSYLFAHKFSLLYVSQRVGHASPEITLKTYAHIMRAVQQDEDSRLEGLFDDF